jgi:hypothetical protein
MIETCRRGTSGGIALGFVKLLKIHACRAKKLAATNVPLAKVASFQEENNGT